MQISAMWNIKDVRFNFVKDRQKVSVISEEENVSNLGAGKSVKYVFLFLKIYEQTKLHFLLFECLLSNTFQGIHSAH